MSDNSILQYILIPMLMTVTTQFISRMEYLNISNIMNFFIEFNWKTCGKTRNSIVLKGERIRSVCHYSGDSNVVESFTNTFSAIWEYIVKNDNDSNFYELTELNNTSSSYIKKEHNTFYFVSQPLPFLVDQKLQLYGKTIMNSETQEKKGTGGLVTCQNITIELFSYTKQISDIQLFLNTITEKYIDKIKTAREKNRYIYTIKQVEYEDYYEDCWNESLFETTRSFDNLFFNEKDVLLKKINFFIENKEWYYEKGLPYTLGIGLSGKPGTGKTSVIKSIAQYTNRHIVNVSMKLFKNRKQLYKFFFETTYNRKNVKDSIGYDNKIIVIEDIDCLGDIVLERKKTTDHNRTNMITTNVLHSIMDKESSKEPNNEKCENDVKRVFKIETDPITLDDILNIFDGIEEHTGRIMIITSNHYEKLDKALTRPGRIDIKMEMSNLSRDSIFEIYNHLYNKQIPRHIMNKIPDYKCTPAEVMNVFLNNQYDEKKFLKQLCIHKIE
jgi:hypothetical protein